MKQEMGKMKLDGVMLRMNMVCTLIYTDNVVLLAENKGEMKRMIEKLEGNWNAGYSVLLLMLMVGQVCTMIFCA